jgi:sugar lactone lactonase YvrE
MPVRLTCRHVPARLSVNQRQGYCVARRWTTRLLAASVAILVASCDTSRSVDPLSPQIATALGSAAPAAMDGAVLFVGNVVVGSSGNAILRYDATGSLIDVFVAPAGCCMTFGPDENLYGLRQGGIHRFNGVTGEAMGVFIPPASGGLGAPLVFVFRADGMLYVGDRITHAIRRYDARTGAFIDAFVPPGSGGMGESDPQFFAFGPDGDIYIASIATNRILRFDVVTKTMDVFVEAGEGGLVSPSGVGFGPDGNLYVGSTTTDRVLRYDADGNFMDEFVPSGRGGLDLPVGLTFGPDGNLYVASAASPATASVLRYDGRTGDFIDAFVAPGTSPLSGPRALEFKWEIRMCHRPPGNPGNAKTVSIAYLSAREHVDHGDVVGPCP